MDRERVDMASGQTGVSGGAADSVPFTADHERLLLLVGRWLHTETRDRRKGIAHGPLPELNVIREALEPFDPLSYSGDAILAGQALAEALGRPIVDTEAIRTPEEALHEIGEMVLGRKRHRQTLTLLAHVQEIVWHAKNLMARKQEHVVLRGPAPKPGETTRVTLEQMEALQRGAIIHWVEEV